MATGDRAERGGELISDRDNQVDGTGAKAAGRDPLRTRTHPGADTTPTGAERLARFASAFSLDDVPEQVRETAKLHLLDALGCALAAMSAGVGTEGQRIAPDLWARGNASVIGLQTGMGAAGAAFANAMLGHALDHDDTHAGAVVHASVVSGPVALAVGEDRGASGAEALVAIVAANEAIARLGLVASGEFHRRGFHPTAVCGVFGAAVAAAMLTELDVDQTVSALGLAGSMASGLFAYLEDGTATKPLHPAWAASGGIVAGALAAAGMPGPQSVLEGRFGLYHTMLGLADAGPILHRQLDDLGTRWETSELSYKAYPACHVMHGALGAIEGALAGRRLTPEEVVEVLVTVPETAVGFVLEPAEAKVAPRSGYEARFSLPYSAGALMAHGELRSAMYTDPAALGDPSVLGLASTVRYAVGEFATFPESYPGAVEIRLADGQRLQAEVDHQKGSPANPLSPDDVCAKFEDNASAALAAPDAAGFMELVLSLDAQPDLRALGALLRRCRPPAGATAQVDGKQGDARTV